MSGFETKDELEEFCMELSSFVSVHFEWPHVFHSYCDPHMRFTDIVESGWLRDLFFIFPVDLQLWIDKNGNCLPPPSLPCIESQCGSVCPRMGISSYEGPEIITELKKELHMVEMMTCDGCGEIGSDCTCEELEPTFIGDMENTFDIHHKWTKEEDEEFIKRITQ